MIVTYAIPVSEYRDAMGDVLLWRFPLTGDLPVVGAPFAGTFGGAIDKPTHFTQIIIPQLVPTR